MKRLLILCLILGSFSIMGCSFNSHEDAGFENVKQHQAVEEKPDFAAMLNDADVLFQQNNYEEAILQYEALIQIEPKSPALYKKLALSYQKQDQAEEAKHVLQNGLKAMPGEKELLQEYYNIIHTTQPDTILRKDSYLNALMVLLPEILLSDEMTGHVLGLLDVNFDGTPELTHVAQIGNAYGDSILTIYKISDMGAHIFCAYEEKEVGYYLNDLYYRDYVELTNGMEGGIKLYKDKQTGDLKTVLLSRWGANSGFGQSAQVLGSLLSQEQTRVPLFALKGHNGTTADNELSVKIQDKYYNFFIDEQQIEQTAYDKIANAFFTTHQQLPLRWSTMHCGENYYATNAHDMLLEQYVQTRANDLLQSLVEALVGEYTAPPVEAFLRDEYLDAEEERRIAQIASWTFTMKPFHNAQELTTRECLSLFEGMLCSEEPFEDEAIQKLTLDRDGMDMYALASKDADVFCHMIFGIGLPGLNEPYQEEYGPFYHEGVYYFEQLDWNFNNCQVVGYEKQRDGSYVVQVNMSDAELCALYDVEPPYEQYTGRKTHNL